MLCDEDHCSELFVPERSLERGLARLGAVGEDNDTTHALAAVIIRMRLMYIMYG
ncbi:unnamed protein product [Laminaria digitata]